MDGRGLGALLLRRSTNFAWHTGGADNRVDHASPFGVADILITRDEEYIFTNNIEAPRMRKEQTLDFEVVEHPWYGDEAAAIQEVVGAAPLGMDFPLDGALEVSGEVASLRYVLDPDALECYWQVGADAAAAVAEATRSLEPGMSEYEAAANLAAACRRRELFSSVLLAAADDRIASYRHPIPHGGQMEHRAMLVVSAERGGLYANVTRMVHFEEHNETVLDVGFLSLGPLKGNRGNQTYELPAEFDPNKHRSISIWCQRFSVNFATAPLR
jgi:Xaa-Pro dipeptidase